MVQNKIFSLKKIKKKKKLQDKGRTKTNREHKVQIVIIDFQSPTFL